MQVPRNGRHAGFTLVEVLIVVIIIGILASTVLPALSARADQAGAATLMANLKTIKEQIQFHHLRNGELPSEIEADWFAAGTLPSHPQNSFGVPAVQVVVQPGRQHPTQRVLATGVAGAYWYNSADGIVRARVADQGSENETLKFYNLVNQCDIDSLGNYTQQVGGS